MTILKASELKADTDRILDEAIEHPQYVTRNGIVLVIHKADLPEGNMEEMISDTWDKLGPSPTVNYDKL